MESIANLMQETACNHACNAGFSNDGFATTPAMRTNRLIWVTTRMHIEVARYPVWGESVEIDTWFQEHGRMSTRRDWILRIPGTGEIIGCGTSTWAMMNQDTRRLSRIPDDVRREFIVYCPMTPRYALDETHVDKIPKLGDPAQTVRGDLVPRRGDLDMNHHVNNVTYIGWMLEGLPLQDIEEAELASITLEYRRECGYSDVVESLTSNEEPTPGAHNGAAAGAAQFVHLLRLQASGVEINRGRTLWRPKSSPLPNTVACSC
eukprot:SM000017S02761  [mRNA]  locus=s17:98757:100351:+ [translate_table: standard]